MVKKNPIVRTLWSSSLGLIFASVGAAVGLGNIWKFPYIAFKNGGGAFVLVYLISIVLIGVPIMIAEMYLGKSFRLNIYSAIEKLTGRLSFWRLLGPLCLFTAFGILSFYSVITGWILSYFLESVSGGLVDLTSDNIGPYFSSIVSSGPSIFAFHTIVMAATGVIVMKGTRMIEKINKILIPTLFVTLIALAGLAWSNYGIEETAVFLFRGNWSELSLPGILEAIGHSFFTLSVGVGATLIYGSYLPKEIPIVRSVCWIAFFDTLVALLSCFLIYPLLFAHSFEGLESPSILFTSLTLQFNTMIGGRFFSICFYFLLLISALTSTVSLLEPVTAFFLEKIHLPRSKATLISVFGIWLFGLGSAMSNGALSWFTEIEFMSKIDYLTSNWTLPLGGIFISLLVGFKIGKKKLANDLSAEFLSPLVFSSWLFLIRFFAPSMVFLIMIWKLFYLTE